MFERKGPRIQCKKGKGQNSNVRKQRAGILMFKRIGQEFQWLERIGPELQCKRDRAGIPKLERKGLVF